jgi:hypothetical protein
MFVSALFDDMSSISRFPFLDGYLSEVRTSGFWDHNAL